ncbi:hypothetical protein HMPREF0083_06194 [Aneurinibacillus aneurinilyticus ATCC 12856]|uniref:Uncharacterized protein n=1 Tax=Aneurinibacillus aneurinilyticus ATCC 12856 TaxID=649747 RepID=U1XZ93_ANEAE|nr:hypothetical protein HMPREF0083_06194 [Aneurinibacillus aneurinilyticus ATCC 12856]
MILLKDKLEHRDGVMKPPPCALPFILFQRSSVEDEESYTDGRITLLASIIFAVRKQTMCRGDFLCING